MGLDFAELSQRDFEELSPPRLEDGVQYGGRSGLRRLGSGDPSRALGLVAPPSLPRGGRCVARDVRDLREFGGWCVGVVQTSALGVSKPESGVVNGPRNRPKEGCHALRECDSPDTDGCYPLSVDPAPGQGIPLGLAAAKR